MDERLRRARADGDDGAAEASSRTSARRWYSHKAEESRPYSYKVYLADYDVTAEVAPTNRAAQFRFTFPKSDDAHILIDGQAGGSMVSIDPARRRITGYVRNNSGGVPANFHN